MKCNTWGLLMRTDCMKSVLLFCLWPIKETHSYNRKFSSCIMVRLDQTQNAFVFTIKIRSRDFFFIVYMLFNQSTFVPFRIPCERTISSFYCLYVCPIPLSKGKRLLTDSLEDSNFECGLCEKKRSLQITIYAPPPTYIYTLPSVIPYTYL